MTVPNNKVIDLKQPWAIRVQGFEFIRALGKSLSYTGDVAPNFAVQRQPNAVAVIPIHGIIVRDDDFLAWAMNGTCISMAMQAFEEAITDPEVRAIVLDVNSCGGEVNGTAEFAQMIFEARGIKPIVSYVAFDGCSAAYWIAAAADKIIMHEAACVGSIGVMAEFWNGDNSDFVTVVSEVSPRKNVDLNTDEGLKQIQNHIDAIANIFVENVAKFRGVDVNKVLSDFGRGDIRIGVDAVKYGMADEIGTFETALATASGSNIIQGEVTRMGGMRAQDVNTDLIDLKWLQENKPELVDEIVKNLDVEGLQDKNPELVDEIKDSGGESETARQAEIDEMEKEEEDESDEVKALYVAAKKDRKMSAGELAMALRKLGSERRTKMKKARHEDANQIPPIGNGQNPPEQNPLVAAGIRTGLIKRRA